MSDEEVSIVDLGPAAHKHTLRLQELPSRGLGQVLHNCWGSCTVVDWRRELLCARAWVHAMALGT